MKARSLLTEEYLIIVTEDTIPWDPMFLLLESIEFKQIHFTFDFCKNLRENDFERQILKNKYFTIIVRQKQTLQ